MESGVWSSFYVDLSPENSILRFAELGWKHLEMSAEHGKMATQEGDWKERLIKLKDLCEKVDVKIWQIHTPLELDIAQDDPDKCEEDMQIALKWAEYANLLDIPNLVIHPGGKQRAENDREKDKIKTTNIEAFCRLAETADKLGVRFCIENMQERIGQEKWRIGARISDIREIIDAVGSESLGICFDSSHANVTGLDMTQAINECEGMLFATHMSDNDGSSDQHRMPFGGNIDWKSVISALRDINYQGLFNLEIPNENKAPLTIRDARLRYARDIMEHLMADQAEKPEKDSVSLKKEDVESRTISQWIEDIKKIGPDLPEQFSRNRLLQTFHNAAERVPHYKKFLESKGIDASEIDSVEEILNIVPAMDKKNYINTIQSPSELCLDGRTDNAAIFTTSSGFTGPASTWPIGIEEEEEGRKNFAFFTEYFFDITKHKNLLINAYATGGWVSGISVSRLVKDYITLFTPGPVDYVILDIIDRHKKDYDQILITAYPPFIKKLVDRAMEKDPDYWKDKGVRFVFLNSGEGFSEGWRDYINQCLDAENRTDMDNFVISTFGASDIGAIGFMETPDSIRIRRAANQNRDLTVKLFGDNSESIPMLFQYNPGRYYITSNKNQELEFSTISPGRIAPLIKYNLHDMGGKITYRDMQKSLRDFGMDDSIDLPLPFLYVFRRTTGEVWLEGSCLHPEVIKESLFEDSKVASEITGRFFLEPEEDSESNPVLSIDIELRNGVEINENRRDHYRDLILDFLTRVDLIKSGFSADNLLINLKEEGELDSKQGIKIRYV
ncbi:TIM barrel protein [Candidatus Poribacteria bacterium]|nr:TIM barrel protein [Candidatus Poribacteria bacterium]